MESECVSMSSEVEIRPARAEDAEAVYAPPAPQRDRRHDGDPLDAIEETQRRLASSDRDDHTFVAVVDGQVVGMADCTWHPGKRRTRAASG